MDSPTQNGQKTTEEDIYKLWEESGFFNPDNLPRRHKKPFTIIMPPPNANGSLHIGHASFVTLEDIMIRYQRMKGKKALWLPGADHAGFETQVVFDKKLEKEGRNRFQIPAEQLRKEILQFTMENKKVMENQLKKLGASCDWSREKFTLDEDVVKIVYNTFEKLKEDGLLYKGERIVNWCPKHQTSLSDVEIKYQERIAPLYYIKYGPIELATVRLETKFGDTAVAVNPKDKRYQQYIGEEIEIDTLIGKTKIKVIADAAVDPNFGTGAVKVTPYHDPVDFEIWQRHKDEIPEPKQVINKFGKLNELAGPYQGMKVEEARQKIAEDMAVKGLLDPVKTDNGYKHNVATCYKCGNVIEPMILGNQWFVKMTEKPHSARASRGKGNSGKLSLRDLAVKAVKDKEVIFIPKRMEKVFLHWMKNLRDWNISRQIVWGIPIPGDTENQVFDTWFSSGQWPFATLMTTGKDDFKNFYPTNVMETGWDILFFWVARMIMLGLYVTKKTPFKYVYLHGLMRDKDRQKMSKSKGNVIDPLGIIDLYGADALRMAVVVGNAPGNDPIIYEEKIKGYRNFITKIKNASRFVMMNMDGYKPGMKISFNQKDKKILKDFEKMAKETTLLMDSFKFYRASEKLYHYFWHTFCDKIIESQKSRLYGEDPSSRAKLATGQGKKERIASQHLLITLLRDLLILLHPFTPFVTEEIYQELPIKNKKKSLMIESWPL
jgi:valyl-tRNA synthetase